MEKVDLATADIAAENAAKLAELFPDIVTEVLDEDGNVRHSIDVEALKAHVGDIAENKRERYQFTWPGKQRARAEAIRPISKTMRPCPEESVNWDTTENLYIEGDNLDALKILRETYAGKIKMIYIDPPYNTGKDFIYGDCFTRSQSAEGLMSAARDGQGNIIVGDYFENKESRGRFHSDWCSMMRSRVSLARDMLEMEGLIVVSIDDNEARNARFICDEVFGARNFLVQVIWKKRSTPPNDQVIGAAHEYALIYAKDKLSVALNLRERSAEQLSVYKNPDNHPKGPWASGDLSANDKGGRYVESLNYAIVNPNTGEEHYPPHGGNWRFNRETMSSLLADGEIYFGKDGKGRPKLKRFLCDVKDGVTYTSLWDFVPLNTQGSTEMRDILGNLAIFDNPKPVGYVKEFLKLGCEQDSIVLDFFSGSATTAHAVMQLNAEDGGNRKFIMVQLPEVCDEKKEAAKAGYKNICEIGKERIRRAGAKIAAEVEDSNAQLKLGEEPKKVPDIGFRVLKIDSSNFEDVKRTPDAIQQDQLSGLADNLKTDRTPEDILFQLFPQFQIPYTASVEKLDICGKAVYSVDDDALLACFDREVSEDVIRAMAEREPSRAVLRDASFVGDDALANFEEIFKTLSPETETRVV